MTMQAGMQGARGNAECKRSARLLLHRVQFINSCGDGGACIPRRGRSPRLPVALTMRAAESASAAPEACAGASPSPPGAVGCPARGHHHDASAVSGSTFAGDE
mmetsp:Transcript_15386/g.37607  ORF Transcript_15386/g.37607 Transcript_15386/m.37607 type:complete len:103 (-) Transcript_15386:467-775(-)|eukprot:CAMPEP_0185211068 /NCGR_PEP_ID=MMETSP1140-20130426/66830_1 /TAXON_ID=298111 /ORGANISM="Pavlova sp., Strain CCMP459" /LENGTH=102 /DNA_ID=CAMNT_0027778907 /DNA_START=3147 /DNA_END=3455 /DNA_ORIENTATION=-